MSSAVVNAPFEVLVAFSSISKRFEKRELSVV